MISDGVMETCTGTTEVFTCVTETDVTETGIGISGITADPDRGFTEMSTCVTETESDIGTTEVSNCVTETEPDIGTTEVSNCVTETSAESLGAAIRIVQLASAGSSLLK